MTDARGAAILNVILNGINLIIQKNASLWEGTIVGSVVILAVLLNVLGSRRQFAAITAPLVGAVRRWRRG